MDESSFDFLLKKVIGVGKWQVKIFFLVFFLIECPFVYYPAFTLTVPVPHRCRIPVLDDRDRLDLTFDDITKFAVPNKSDSSLASAMRQHYYPCIQYNISSLIPLLQKKNYTGEELFYLQSVHEDIFSFNNTIACQNGYIYDTRLDYHKGTAVEQFNLVCGRESLIPTATMVFMLGQIVASVLSGFLADKFGRRKVICVAALFTYIFGFSVSLSPNILSFIMFRFFMGYTTVTAWITSWVLLTEITTSSVRNVLITILEISFGFIFTGIFTVMAFVCEDWALLHTALTLITAPSILLFCFLPESPRWLLVNNREIEAQNIIMDAWKFNNRNVANQEAVEFEIAKIERRVEARKSLKDECKSLLVSVIILIKAKEIRWRTAILAFEWLIIGMTYYGITFYSVTLPGNPYLTFFLLSLGSIPGNICQLVLYHKFDRKIPLMFVMGATCPILIGISLYQHFSGANRIVIIIIAATTIGKVLTDCLHSMFYIWTPELFPTEIRNYAMGVCSAMTRIGSALAPYIIQLGETIWIPFPFMILGILLSVCVLLNIFLPNTKKQPLPDTVEGLKARNEGRHSVPNSSMSEESL